MTNHIKPHISSAAIFEKIKRTDNNNNEFWTARDLAEIFQYSEFRHFLPVIAKAKDSCKNSGYEIIDHFEDFIEMIDLANKAKRKISNVKLSRYACYLLVQNADPAKEIVALGQTYFAIQTRLQEISQMDGYKNLINEDERRFFLRNELTKHNIYLASAAKEAGVISPIDYAIFQNHGYKGLYGGLDTKNLHKKKNLGKSQKILDHMGSTELAANLFRATQAEEKIRRDKIKGKEKANNAHFEVGKKVRQTIKELGGQMPENMPTTDSIKQVKKRLEKRNTELLEKTSKLNRNKSGDVAS